MRDSSDTPITEADPLIGREIHHMRIVERIGQGGMGAVYKAEHTLLHEPRALKVLRSELFDSLPNAVERFEREARIAVRLRHPNLVLLYDFFVEENHHFLVMEYVMGTSLAAFLREHGALSVEGTCRIGIQCCAGLAHAHEMGIVHRDLSPENVMLASSESGMSVKIIDFGVARAAFGPRGQASWGDSTLTGANEFIGKPAYSSPEQAGALQRGEVLDHRSDIYTLGLILFEMATGQQPFAADSPFDYLSHHVHEPPPRPSEIAPDLAIPSELERVILRCLEKDRDRRYATARELSEDLDRTWRASDARAVPAAVSRGVRAHRAARRRRNRIAPIAAGVAIAAVGAGAGALWWLGRDAPREEIAAPEPAEAIDLPPIVPEPAPDAAPPPVAPEPPPEPAPDLAEAAQPEPVLPTPPAAEPEPQPAPTPIAAKPAPEPAPPKAAPKPAPAKPRVAAFANQDEMQRAFDAALEFERTHDKTQSIAKWKEFRGRSPSGELDEKAKRRITELTLGSLPGL